MYQRLDMAGNVLQGHNEVPNALVDVCVNNGLNVEVTISGYTQEFKPQVRDTNNRILEAGYWYNQPTIGSITRLPRGLMSLCPDTGMVWVTPHRDKKQQLMKFGKFLKKLGCYSDAQVRESSSALKAYVEMFNGAELQFTTTGEEVRRVYEDGPNSCMSNESAVQIYVGDDVSVAYVKIGDRIVARTVVCKNPHIGLQWVCIYGNRDIIIPLLERAGYESGDLNGCRVPVVTDYSGNIMCPYIDGPDYANLDGDFIEFCTHGDHHVQQQSGYLEERKHCLECGDSMHPDEAHYSEHEDDDYCSECYHSEHIERNGEWYNINQDCVVQLHCGEHVHADDACHSEHTGKYYREDDVVYSETMEDCIPTDEAVEAIVVVGDPDDDFRDEEEDWMHMDLVTKSEDCDGYDIYVWDNVVKEYNNRFQTELELEE